MLSPGRFLCLVLFNYLLISIQISELNAKMSSTTKRVIIDGDFGFDDAYALLTLLYAENHGLLKIEAIVCSMGNAAVIDVCKNLVRLLEIFQRTDIPVYKGASKALITNVDLRYYNGKDGFGDLKHDHEPDLRIIQKEPAAIGLHKLVTENPGEISLICMAPLTNIALSMSLYDDFSNGIKEIFIMGANQLGAYIREAEYNFYVDPESAYKVFKNTKCPVFIVPLETCLDMNITFDWRFNVLGNIKNDFMDLLNKAEKNILPQPIVPEEIWYPYDVLLAIVVLYPKESIVQQSKHNLAIDLVEIKGRIVLDQSNATDDPNFTIIEKINEEIVKEVLLKAAVL